MPVLRRLGEPTGPVAPGDAAGPALERIVPFTFTDPAPPPGPADLQPFVDHMESLHGEFTDLSWLTGGTVVSYHDMVRAVVDELGPALADVDLVITVDGSPDCRHQSFPGALLADLLPGEPLMMGISEQGVAGPFTALRVAHHQLRTGGARRALIVVMEQSTLPPDDTAVRPTRDVAVALLLGGSGTLTVDAPTLAVTRTGPAGWPVVDADLLVAGAHVDDLPTGKPVRRAEPDTPASATHPWRRLRRRAGAVCWSTTAGAAVPVRGHPHGAVPPDRRRTAGRGRPTAARSAGGHHARTGRRASRAMAREPPDPGELVR
ncbi:hypothetical protein MRQ36_32020 [Micromonospora sp. R77]|uniref:hypothetical protein n=1 Tax=Micromonospora sp. R77 TaxID=2925836 RepID=UPI001F60A71D|nr:hypothetical protein [Micromonospora sp. R77]MCI4066942.1 hypothetical protein [Micromonospora sp. R77]